MNRHVSFLNIRNSVVFFVLLVIGMMLMPIVVTAEVVKVEIKSREVVTTSKEYLRSGPYEVINEKGDRHQSLRRLLRIYEGL